MAKLSSATKFTVSDRFIERRKLFTDFVLKVAYNFPVQQIGLRALIMAKYIFRNKLVHFYEVIWNLI